MILSMTGFAAVAAELPGVSLAVELRSVNHRYLDLQVRLPDELRALEPALRETLSARLEARQGRMPGLAQPRRQADAPALAVDAGARRRSSPTAAAEVTADRPGRRAAVGRRDPALARRAGRADRRRRPSSPRTRVALVDEALRRARRVARRAKARRLAAMLVERCDGIEAQVARVAPRIPAIHAAYTEKLGARLREAGLDSERGPAEAGARALRDQGRRRRGAARLDAHVARSAARARGRRQRRQAPRLPRCRSCTARRTRWARSRSTPSCRRRRSSSRC